MRAFGQLDIERIGPPAAHGELDLADLLLAATVIEVRRIPYWNLFINGSQSAAEESDSESTSACGRLVFGSSGTDRLQFESWYHGRTAATLREIPEEVVRPND